MIDVAAERAVPASGTVESLLAFVRPALEAHGEWGEKQRRWRAEPCGAAAARPGSARCTSARGGSRTWSTSS